MVGKLIATDLRQSWRPIVIASALVIAFTTLGGLLVGFKVPFFASIFSLLIVIAPFALLAGILVYLLVRYYRTMYGRVGYFTHSLPATGAQLFWAKLLYGLIAMTIALVAAVIALQPVWMSLLASNDIPLSEGPRMLADQLATMPRGFWPVSIAMLLVTVLGYIIHYQFVISVGSEARLNHLGIGGPVVVYVLVYLAGQIISLVSFVAIPLMVRIDSGFHVETGSAWQFIVDSMSKTAPPNVIPIGWAPAQVIMLIALAWWTIRSIRLHTSLR